MGAFVPNPEIFDRDAALGRMANNPKLLERVIQRFKDSCPKLMDKLRAAIDSQDAANLKSAAHSLKGAALNLGAGRFVASAQKLEDLASAQQFQGAGALAEELNQELALLISEFDAP